MRAPIIILSGPPGAGKSTVAPLLASHFAKSVVVPMDEFFRFIRSGHIPPFLPEAAKQNEVVTRVLAVAAAGYASGGYTVILDGIVGPWFLEIYQEAARSDNLELHYVVLRPSSEIAMGRAVDRHPGQLRDPQPVSDLYLELSDLGSYEEHVVDSSVLDSLSTAELALDGLEAGRYRLLG